MLASHARAVRFAIVMWSGRQARRDLACPMSSIPMKQEELERERKVRVLRRRHGVFPVSMHTLRAAVVPEGARAKAGGGCEGACGVHGEGPRAVVACEKLGSRFWRVCSSACVRACVQAEAARTELMNAKKALDDRKAMDAERITLAELLRVWGERCAVP